MAEQRDPTAAPFDRGLTPNRPISRRSLLKGMAGAAAATGNLGAIAELAGAVGGANTVSAENALPGAPPSEWESWRSDTIVGYAAGFTFLPGETVPFKVKTSSANYRVRIYRLGWYQGHGARRVAEIMPSAPLPQVQPTPLTQPATGLVDAGNWAVSASWTIPANAVSGVYYALFERLDVADQSNHTLFVVRRPGPSDVLVQTSDTTWQAYNRWGGASLYWGTSGSRAYKVSYNRPLEPDEQENDFLNTEYTLVRFLERNGYDVAYFSCLDAHRRSIPSAKVFVSSGHDEYWSGPQRNHVEAARDAGTSLMFLSGNEVFWKVRFEPAIDGSAAPDRTLVCYKETLDGAKIDPSPEWTGTWRDPRFSPPSDAGRPENRLTGQLFRCINPIGVEDFAIEVPAQYKNLRFWRGTAAANLGAGQILTLAPSTLGYEWDQDVDNGFRPAGLIHLSQTTATAQDVLQDYGKTYATQSVTHHLTLYRAASGALVFGAGTVQWAYGLDAHHLTDPGVPTDPNIQQATVNLLADMGVQPATLQAGVAPASKSTDGLAPVSSIIGPVTGAALPVGHPVTVTGTALDAGGGVVAAVEVSVDGGTTWRPAVGRESWSFVFTPLTLGPLTIRARAVDDSLNLEIPGPGVTVECVQRPLPAPLFAAAAPTVADSGDPSAIEVGVKFRPLIDGFVTGIRFYKSPLNTGLHLGRLWSAAGAQLASTTFAAETASGWQTAPIPPTPVSAGVTYVVSVYMPNGHYAGDAGFFNAPYELWPLRALANGEDGANAVYRYGSAGFPTSTFGAANYWVDPVFDIDNQANPTVIDHAPGAGVELASRQTAVTVTFSEAMQASSLALELRGPDGALMSGSLSYDSTARRATFSPAAALASHTAYTATLTGAQDVSGDSITAPFSWTFTTTGEPGSTPTGVWDGAAAPQAVASEEHNPVELGLRFRTSTSGEIKALRFYKAPGSPGPHVGHLWADDGSLLATATFANETASGWQQAELTTPVAVQKNRDYVVSCFHPNGVIPYSTGYFSSGSTVRGPLQAPQSTDAGRNGLYRYGPSGLPTSSWLDTNYWVDVVFRIPPDTAAPTIANVTPAPGLVAVARSSAISAVFDEPINPASLSFTLRNHANAPIAGAVTYDAASHTAVFTPSAPLAAGELHTASLSAADPAGNAMSTPLSWSFTTSVAAPGTPATLWESTAAPAVAAADDASPLELGVRFSVDRPGVVSGVRFYKGAGNAGPHVGHLWGAGGQLLAATAFADETAWGWQQARFAAPVTVVPGEVYVASYFAPQGRYSVDAGWFSGGGADRAPLHAPGSSAGGNGVFAYGNGAYPSSTWNGANYWVDVIFEDLAGPSVIRQQPAAGAVDVSVGATVSAVFDENVQAATIAVSLRDAGGALVSGAAAYDPGERTVTFTPSSSLAHGAAYTASVSGARDVDGNPMAAPSVWSFTTAAAGLHSFWTLETIPAAASSGDSAAVELGLRFTTAVTGRVRGVRFYKGPGNTGVHVGRLWTDAGGLLASTTFANESGAGWQYAPFSAPVPVAAGQVYVVSYHAPNGNYAVNGGYFTADRTSGPLTAPASQNGVFAYGAGGFPTGTWGGGNYWVDLVFEAD
ncbi:MAG: DUF4082 domain-containing protein [Acidimicrobiales bacterium]